MGTCFLLCMLGGFLADSFLGRYATIAVFAAVQTLGTGMLAVTTAIPRLRPPPCHHTAAPCTPANGFQMAMLYVALYLTALGTGGLKSSVSGFGTDQFDENDDREKAAMAYFFNRFFFFISIGTLTAVTVVVYIQDAISRSLAYGICTVSMLAAILVFLFGTRRYRYKKSTGRSPVVQIFQVVSAAVRKRRMKIPCDAGQLYEDTPDGSRIAHTYPFSFLDKAAIVSEGDLEKSTYNPWKLCPVTKVEEVKMVGRLLPVWATTIIFWTTYAQMITFSVQQASTMDRTIIGGFTVPAGSLTVFFVAAILVTLALYDRVIMPLWNKWKGEPGFSSLQRIGIGLALSTIGMGVAALAEAKRLRVAKTATDRHNSSLPITVFILIPQFFLVGSGEAFIYTGQLDFFITRSPKGMKTMSTALFLTTISLGFFVSTFLVSVAKRVTASGGGRRGWLADDIDLGRLDCFYGLLAVLGAVNLAVYLVCAAWYGAERVANVAGAEGGDESKC